MKKFWNVFLFHFKESVIAKSSVIMSVILFLLAFGVFGVSHFMNEREGIGENDKVIIISEAAPYQLQASELNELVEDITFINKEPSEMSQAKEEIKSGEATGLIVIKEKDGIPSLTHIFNHSGNNEALVAVSSMVQQQYIAKTITENNITPEVAAKILAQIEVNNEPLQDFMQSFGISYFFGFLLYMFLVMFGSAIATGIASEKSSRVMEVMISKVKPMYMMFAKILAVFCTAIVQLLVLGAGFALAYAFNWVEMNNISFLGIGIDLSNLGWDVIVAFIVFFVLGYLLYGMMFAAAGSIVSRMEDLQMISMPITFLIIAAFFINMKSLTDPTATISVISSYIPFFAPLVTFSRFVSGEANAVEMSISIGLLIAAIAIITMIASRIYVNGVMHYGEKLKWKEVGRFLKRS